jgi:RNA polymerase sigma factor (sigma-70 family)
LIPSLPVRVLTPSATNLNVAVFSKQEIMRVGVRAVIESIPSQAEGQDTAIGFDEAFTLHHRAVFATARAILRDAALAEEVTQDVFLKLYRHLDSAPGGELLRPWLLRVTLNESRNAIRGRNRALARDTAYEKTRQEATMEFEPDSSKQLEAARRALDKIKEPMRSCLILRQQGLSYREIAETLSVKENYVGSLVARARKEFTRTYGKIGASR